jgi:hypothetical protein
MDDDPCPVHREYDGVGDPPDPGCAHCLELQDEVAMT